MKTTTPLVTNSISRGRLRRGFTLPVVLALGLACFALLPAARAECRDGCDNTNTFQGEDALLSNTGGNFNTATGLFALSSNTIGSDNTANGDYALGSNVDGNFNTANGANALFSNTAGRGNTATGSNALLSNTGGNFNTATGFEALSFNTTGTNNTATGFHALLYNETGDNNTANGINALYSNTEGIDNTATGLNALFNNMTGNDNTANGHSALESNTEGNDNTADGHDALFNNTTGSDNIAMGHGAGQNLTTGDNNIDIGNSGVAGESNTIRIGHPGFFVEPGVLVGGHKKTFIAGISGTAIGGGAAVRINADGQLGTAPSSARFKEEIKPMGEVSETILALKPVTFRYKPQVDPDRVPQFGLVAEEVEKVNPALVVRDPDGKPYTVRYEAVNAMLLNEFLKEHKKVEKQQAQIGALNSRVASQESIIAQQHQGMEKLAAQLKEQAGRIQKVSAQIEMNKPAVNVVLNNR
jgi:uncharacterized coiled-coil protein SlyX